MYQTMCDIRSGISCAVSWQTRPPVELPTRTTWSSPRSSMNSMTTLRVVGQRDILDLVETLPCPGQSTAYASAPPGRHDGKHLVPAPGSSPRRVEEDVGDVSLTRATRWSLGDPARSCDPKRSCLRIEWRRGRRRSGRRPGRTDLRRRAARPRDGPPRSEGRGAGLRVGLDGRDAHHPGRGRAGRGDRAGDGAHQGRHRDHERLHPRRGRRRDHLQRARRDRAGPDRHGPRRGLPADPRPAGLRVGIARSRGCASTSR